jgi:hypothetical protein
MDSLFNILGNRDFDEPPEIAMIKRYIKSQYNTEVGVQVRERDIVIVVPSSALANTLRLNGPTIKRYCGVDKRLTFRIGK